MGSGSFDLTVYDLNNLVTPSANQIPINKDALRADAVG
jgi:hypothetical protein